MRKTLVGIVILLLCCLVLALLSPRQFTDWLSRFDVGAGFGPR